MIVTGHDDHIARWVGERLGVNFAPPFVCIGFVHCDRLAGGAVFNDYNGANIELSLAADRPAFTPGNVKAVFRYAFEVANCRRLTVRTSARNKKARKLALKLGFECEARLKHYYPDSDALQYVMLRDSCRWL